MTTAGAVGFDVDSFTWADGAFVVTGRWTDDAGGLGRVRLLVDVDGRRRNLGAQGGKEAGGDAWRGTFACATEPDPDASAALKVGELEIALPSPDLAPAPEEQEARSLIEEIRAERASLDRARHALAKERKAAEEVAARLTSARHRVGDPKETPPEYTVLGYIVAGAIALLFLIVLVWVL